MISFRIDLNTKKKIFLLLFIFLGLSHTKAQNKKYFAQRANAETPVIDGSFNDSIWQKGIWESNFFQNSPNNGATPSQKTAFQIYYDNDFIYVAIKAFDNDPSKIDKKLSRRDGMTGDRIAIEIDSYNDKRTSFMFGVNAAGVKNDGIIVSESGTPDLTIDPIWFVKTQIDVDGWNVEMKIPVSQLRFNDNEEKIWGFQIVRFYFRNQETDTWQNVPESLSGWVNHYGELHGIKNLKTKKSVEIAPYVLGKVEAYPEQVGNPFADGRDLKYDVGIDGKIGITNDITLDFAINPDFGQVEADPSVVNLTAFETFYAEKRPFFIEGNNITNYKLDLATQDNLFYSRRIGRAPQGSPNYSDGEYFKIPERTRILGAVKLSGKTQNGWSIAVIENLTKEEKATIDLNGERRKETVEPATNYFLARTQKDINKGNTIIGGIFTSVYRNITTENLNFLNTSASTGSVDFKQYFKDRKYTLAATFAASNITGSTEAILNQQLSSRRYFQRPGAAHTVDSTLTSMSGVAGTLIFSKNANTGFNYGTFLTWRSPGFETNDLGYLKKADYIFQDAWSEYIISKPFSIFRRINLNGDISTVWDFRKLYMYSFNTSGYLEFVNHWNLNFQLSRTGENIQNATLRGGPALKLPGYWEYLLMAHTSRTKKLRFGAAIWQALYDENSGKYTTLVGSITYRPINSLMIYVSPTYEWAYNQMQYVTQAEYNNDARYILSDLNQESFYLTFRIDFNITPDLTLQYYASPYISGALYDQYKQVTDPNADHYLDRYHNFNSSEISYNPAEAIYNISESASGLTDYSFYKPDFNFKQFRSNFVLRWEFRAGSAFYFVWSQSRTGIDSNGTFDYQKDLSNLFKISPTDVLLLKFSYRFMN